MEISVAEYAQREGLSERRVRQLAEMGRLPARRVGRAWLIDAGGADQRRVPVRPMAAANAHAMAQWLQGRAANLSPNLRHRFRGMRSRLEDENQPELLLSAWLANRAERQVYTAQPDDLTDLRGDPRLQLSGVSSDASGLLAGREVEGYVSQEDLAAVVRDYLLVDAALSRGNVVLHVADLSDEVPLSFITADLVERGGVRERQAAREILDKVLQR